MRIFLPKNRIVCQLQNSLCLDRCSSMNASSTEPNHKISRAAGRAQSHAARGRGIWSRRVQNAAERGGRRRKIWNASKDIWKPCNPLKSHKTAKAFFGKAWSKTCDFWRSLEKGLEGAFIPPRLLPPANASDGAESSLRGAKLRSHPRAAPRGPPTISRM